MTPLTVGGLLTLRIERGGSLTGRLRPKMRPREWGRQCRCGARFAKFLVSMAEDRRFELLRGFPQHAFQACALGH